MKDDKKVFTITFVPDAAGGGNFVLRDSTGYGIDTGPKSKPLNRRAWEMGADEVKHMYDLRLDDL